ncbi:MAG: DNA methyltransferase, partial [Candidatus Thorarchaeota archaeon]
VINIDGCRVGTDELKGKVYNYAIRNDENIYGNGKGIPQTQLTGNDKGRFPANVIHDGSDEVVREFPDSKGQQGNVKGTEPSGVTKDIYGKFNSRLPAEKRNDKGSASRFFYVAKASKAERNEGLEELKPKMRSNANKMMGDAGTMKTGSGNDRTTHFQNFHPTVKPVKLIRYLCRLITPPNGLVLDPYLGSGTTGVACREEGFNFIGFEKSEEYEPIIKGRLTIEKPDKEQQSLGDF